MNVLGALLRKELRIELRTLEAVPGMSLFAVTTFVVFHFALDRPSVEGDLASGVLVVTVLFAAMLGINRLWVADEEQGGFDAVLLAPIDRTSLFVAKALAMLVYLAVLEIVALPAFAFLLLEPPIRAELLLLDEPRANLDPAASDLVQPLLSGRTRVVTSHDPAGGLAEADIALGLRGGRTELLAPAGEVSIEQIGALYRS